MVKNIMILNFHLSRTVLKQLNEVRRSGKKGAYVADQCERILDIIRKQGPRCKEVLCKRTKNGEYRLDNCVKYDLSNGYRMVTIQTGNHIFIIFVGSHDKTDQWLEIHRLETFSVDDRIFISEIVTLQEIDENNTQGICCEPIQYQADDYEEHLQSKINEPLLRSIFAGLIR